MTLTVEQEQEARKFLADLREEIKNHAGVGHSILGRMKTDPRSRFDFKVLAGQHFPLVGNFCAYMELLLINAPDSEAKCWLAKVLVDEYGERSDGEDHAEGNPGLGREGQGDGRCNRQGDCNARNEPR